jgi:DNA-binding NtrC family response regulator
VTKKPLNIVLVTGTPEAMTDLFRALQRYQAITVGNAATPQHALAAIQAGTVDVLVVDETVGETSGLQFVREVVSRYPLINCALVSSLPADDFHEATEGLGIFLQVPVQPGTETAEKLVVVLDKIYGLLAKPDTERRQS